MITAGDICELLAEGVSAVRACKEVGVPMRTLIEWIIKTLGAQPRLCL